jgi:hypothetical protein
MTGIDWGVIRGTIYAGPSPKRSKVKMSAKPNTQQVIAYYEEQRVKNLAENDVLAARINVMRDYLNGKRNLVCKRVSNASEKETVTTDPCWDWANFCYYFKEIKPEVGKWYKTHSGRLIRCEKVITGANGAWAIGTSEFCSYRQDEIKCEVEIIEK